MEKEYLIEKWLANDLSESERKAFEQLEDHDFLTEIIDSAQYFKASEFSSPPPFEELEARISSDVPVRKISWIRPLLRLTGAIVVGLGIYFLFFFSNLTEVTTLASEKTTIELPDASTVTLNAASALSYNKKRWKQNREVNLDGEAYFKVAKGKVFDVITEDGVVTVVGTQFSVKQRQDYFEVKCYEGIVRVTTPNEIEELKAGDGYRLYQGISSKRSVTYQAPQWIKEVSDFRSMPFSEVIAELERQYNVKVDYEGVDPNRLFTGGFVHNNLENALRSITAPQELTYTLESDNQVRLKKSGQ